MKIVFVASIIRNSLCIIYVFLLFFFKNHFLLKIIFWLLRSIWLPGVHCILALFDQKLFPNCCDKVDYPGSIVYFSHFECIILLFFRRISGQTTKRWRIVSNVVKIFPYQGERLVLHTSIDNFIIIGFLLILG